MSSDICKLGWLGVGGGGYHPVNVARLWTLFLAVMLDEDVPNEIPTEFKEACIKLGYQDIPDLMRDEEEVVQMYVPREEVALDLERTIRRVIELIFQSSNDIDSEMSIHFRINFTTISDAAAIIIESASSLSNDDGSTPD